MRKLFYISIPVWIIIVLFSSMSYILSPLIGLLLLEARILSLILIISLTFWTIKLAILSLLYCTKSRVVKILWDFSNSNLSFVSKGLTLSDKRFIRKLLIETNKTKQFESAQIFKNREAEFVRLPIISSNTNLISNYILY